MAQHNRTSIGQFLERDMCLQRDWYGSFDAVKPYLMDVLRELSMDASILVLGSGLATLPLRLYEMGFRNVTCVDASATCCEMMKLNVEQAFGEEGVNAIRFQTLDVKELSNKLPTNHFDLVIDKAVLDYLFMEDNYDSYWEGVADTKEQHVRQVQQQVLLLLKQNCKWVAFSNYDYSMEPKFGEDREDLTIFENESCKQIDAQFDEEENFFVYTLQK